MDRYEVNVKIEQIKKLAKQKEFAAAARIADTIDFYRIKENKKLSLLADVYEASGKYEQAKEVLIEAYERTSLGRQLAYRLVRLCIKSGNIREAEEFYQDFIKAAPRDNSKYILMYELATAKGETLDKRIVILETYLADEMDEKWAFELAKLYHKTGQKDKCVRQCDDVILWFSDGKYVDRAMELKMIYAPLTKTQQHKYEERWRAKAPSGVNIDEIKVKEYDIHNRYNTVNIQKALKQSMDALMKGEDADVEEESRDEKALELDKTKVIHTRKPANEFLSRTIMDVRMPQRMNNTVPLSPLFDMDSFGQIELNIDEPVDDQIEGQMSIDEVLDAYQKRGTLAADTVKDEPAPARVEPVYPEEVSVPEEAPVPVEEIPVPVEEPVFAEEIPIPVEEPVFAEEIPVPVEEPVFAEEIPVPVEGPESLFIGGEAIPEPESLFIGEETAYEEVPAEAEEEPAPAESLAGEDDWTRELLGAIGVEVETPVEIPIPKEPSARDPFSINLFAEEEVQAEEEPAPEPQPENDNPYDFGGSMAYRFGEPVSWEDSTNYEEPSIQDDKAAESPESIFQEDENTEQTDLDDIQSALMEAATFYANEASGEYGSEEKETVQEQTEDVLSNEESAVATQETEREYTGQYFAEAVSEEAFSSEKVPSEEVLEEVPFEGKDLREKLPEEEDLRKKKADNGGETPSVDNKIVKDLIKDFVAKYSGIQSLDRQLLIVLQEVLLNGNARIIVMGEIKSGKTALAIDLVKIINKIKEEKGRKIAKINGEVLNGKNVANYFQKLADMDIIIEKAGTLSSDTIRDVIEQAESDKTKIIVLEDEKGSAENLLKANPELDEAFKGRIIVKQNKIRDWVVVAKEYANERGYEIEEMGMLALHAKIDELYAISLVIGKNQVEEVVNQAIEKSNKRGKGLFKIFSKDKEKLLKEGDFL